MPRRRKEEPAPPPPPAEVDLNQVVAYNVRAARELRGWTQLDFAERLEPYVGSRLTQAAVSSIERAWDGERRREFDAQELAVFALVFDLPVLWFLLPPPEADPRLLRGTNRPLGELYALLLGRPDQLGPVYERLRSVGVRDPEEAEEIVERVLGRPAEARHWSYRERRKELLLALLDQHADALDAAIDELGGWMDHLRQVGIRGFLAENTGDADYTYVDAGERAAGSGKPDQQARGGSRAPTPSSRQTGEAARGDTGA